MIEIARPGRAFCPERDRIDASMNMSSVQPCAMLRVTRRRHLQRLVGALYRQRPRPLFAPLARSA